ncbi:MAG: hypothetical protein WC781_02725 [Candidatus Pacearchaeota archaeon]|jgi:hypothetical protein
MLSLNYIGKIDRLNKQTSYISGDYQSSSETELRALKDLSDSVGNPSSKKELRVNCKFEYIENPRTRELEIMRDFLI